MVLGVTEMSISALVVFSLRNILGRAFVSDNQIAAYVRRMTPYICLTMIFDSIHRILSGNQLSNNFFIFFPECVVLFAF